MAQMYDGYRAIAQAYDRFNADVDYEAWAAFIEAAFDRFLPARPRIVLDLACGTGRMTFPLADRGYDMIGIDGSADMLAEATQKNYERQDRLFEGICTRMGVDPDGPDTDAAMEKLAETPAPLFLEQDMRAFELYGTVDATVVCLDSMNYLCGDGKWLEDENLYETLGGDAKKWLFDYLLLANVSWCIERCGVDYDFYRHSLIGSWSIEHVHARNQRMLSEFEFRSLKFREDDITALWAEYSKMDSKDAASVFLQDKLSEESGYPARHNGGLSRGSACRREHGPCRRSIQCPDREEAERFRAER